MMNNLSLVSSLQILMLLSLWNLAATKRSAAAFSSADATLFSSPALPRGLQDALDKTLFESKIQDDACQGHIVLTAPPPNDGDSGFADRLRGLVTAAALAAGTGRKLHVHPHLMGPLLNLSRRNVSDWLEEMADEGMRCSRFTSRKHWIHAHYQNMRACANTDVISTVIASRAAVILFNSNCYNFFVPRLLHTKIPPRRMAHVTQLRACFRQNSSMNIGTHAEMGTLLQGKRLAPIAHEVREQCPGDKPGWTQYTGVGDPRLLDSNHPPHTWHCSGASATSKCATYLLHTSWAAEWPQLYRVLQAAERMHARWQQRFAPGGYRVLHLRSASTTLSLSDTCDAPSVPWHDPIPGEWESLGTTASKLWLQLLAQPPSLPANTARGAPKINLVVLSDSVRLKQSVVRLIGNRANVLSCCSQPVHVSSSVKLEQDTKHDHTQTARQLLFDLITMARSQLLVHGSGMLSATGMHWLSWEQGPVLAPAWRPEYVRGALSVLFTPW